MANAILSFVNHVDNATLSASSVAGDLAASNLADKASRRVWRAGSGSAWCQADFGSSVEIGVIALAFPRSGILPAAADTVQLQLDDATAGTGALYDSGAVASGVVAGYGIFAAILATPISARYLRASLVTANSYVQAGRLWAGPYVQPTRNFQFGWSEQWLDLTAIVQPPRSGVRFRNPGAIVRQVAMTWNYLAAADAEAIGDGLAAIGTQGQMLVCGDPDNPARRTIIGGLAAPAPIAQPLPNLFSVPLTISED